MNITNDILFSDVWLNLITGRLIITNSGTFTDDSEGYVLMDLSTYKSLVEELEACRQILTQLESMLSNVCLQWQRTLDVSGTFGVCFLRSVVCVAAGDAFLFLWERCVAMLLWERCLSMSCILSVHILDATFGQIFHRRDRRTRHWPTLESFGLSSSQASWQVINVCRMRSALRARGVTL